MAMNQHAEAARSDAASRDTAAGRPDVLPLEEAIRPFSGRSFNLEPDVRGSTKRPKEVAELAERAIGKEPKTKMRAAVDAIASSSGSIPQLPANNADLTPWNAIKAPVHISELDQQPLAVAHGKAASSRAAVVARGRSEERKRPARGESADRHNLTDSVLNEIVNDELDGAEGKKKGARTRSRSKSRPAVSLPPMPHDESGGRPIGKVRSTSRQAFRGASRAIR